MAPPSGCHFRTRCPFVQGHCAEVRPPPEYTDAGTLVACMRWREIGPDVGSPPEPPTLNRSARTRFRMYREALVHAKET